MPGRLFDLHKPLPNHIGPSWRKFAVKGRIESASPFDRGFTNVVYRVTESTNFSGIRLPGEAVLDTFGPEPWSNRPELVHYTRYSIRITGLSTNAGRVQFRPELPGPTKICDARVNRPKKTETRLFGTWPDT
jgi:hypothetical protein